MTGRDDEVRAMTKEEQNQLALDFWMEHLHADCFMLWNAVHHSLACPKDARVASGA